MSPAAPLLAVRKRQGGDAESISDELHFTRVRCQGDCYEIDAHAGQLRALPISKGLLIVHPRIPYARLPSQELPDLGQMQSMVGLLRKLPSAPILRTLDEEGRFGPLPPLPDGQYNVEVQIEDRTLVGRLVVPEPAPDQRDASPARVSIQVRPAGP